MPFLRYIHERRHVLRGKAETKYNRELALRLTLKDKKETRAIYMRALILETEEMT